MDIDYLGGFSSKVRHSQLLLLVMYRRINRVLFSIFLLSQSSHLFSQIIINPDLNGVALLESIVEEYKPDSVMTYAQSRDTMYLKVYRENGFIECYYTGYKIFLPDGINPRFFLFNDEDDLGIGAEHIYPQSKGASEGYARSDMHILVPAIWQVNEARSNYPFAEIDDLQTDLWFFDSAVSTELPSENIGAYSEFLDGELGPGRFEPREYVKGDIARAVFYFYTMYQEEADDADPNYFHLMKDQLFAWHLQDPADSLEIVRNEIKSIYQGGKQNPFIIDCSLVGRGYFGEETSDCLNSISTSVDDISSTLFSIYPNPTNNEITLLSNEGDERYIALYDSQGKALIPFQNSNNISLDSYPSGLYFLAVRVSESNAMMTYPVVLLKK